MNSQAGNTRILLRRNVGEVQVEVRLSTEDEFRECYALLRRLCSRVLIEDARLDAEVLWIYDEDGRHLVDMISDSGDRIALSLLDSWPDSKRNSDVVSDTGLSRAGVYDYLTGRSGDLGSWFEPHEDRYRLSRTGEARVVALVSRYAPAENSQEETS